MVHQLWLAVRVVAWMFRLTVSFHHRPLTAILDAAGQGRSARPGDHSDVSLTVRVVRRVSRLALFSLPMFPKPCLREALVAFYMLRRAGYPVRFLVGVRKHGDSLVAHSWVTLHDEPLLPARDQRSFSTVYCHPAESNPEWFTSDAAASCT